MDNKDTAVSKAAYYSALVWILSAIVLFIIGGITAGSANVPGVGEMIARLSTLNARYIYLAAFIFIFIEGLYIVGSFFPGASLALFLAIISTLSGPLIFLVTILFIFTGWSLAGVVNILVARAYREKIIKLKEKEDYAIINRAWSTWYPSFRASHEVAQIIEGGNSYKIFFSSLRVRFWASLVVGGIASTIPFFFDIKKITNREGYISLIIIATISLAVGLVKIRAHSRL